MGTAFAFDNEIAVVELSGAELLASMENAVSRVPDRDGRFPQIAGMTLAYDASLPGVSDEAALDTVSRIQELVVLRDEPVVLVSGGEVVGDLEETFVMVTNSFLLTGGDGYNGLLAASETRGSQLSGLGERQIFVDYIQAVMDAAVDMPEPLEDGRVVRLDEGEE